MKVEAKKKGLSILLFLFISFFCSSASFPYPGNEPVTNTAKAEYSDSWYDSSWGYRKEISIDHTKVSNADQTNFPVLVSLTDNSLKTVGNGGHVTNANGYDIIFTSTSGVRLAHEIESYDGINGTIVMWVKIPTLSYTSDTLFYLYYGNNVITTSQENKTNVWNDGGANHFKGVWHMKEDPSGAGAQMKDSAFSANNGTTYGSMASNQSVTGKIGRGLSFDGSNDYVDCGNGSSLNISSQLTMEGWAKMSNGTSGGALMYKWNNSVFAGYFATLTPTSAGFRLGFGNTTDATFGTTQTFQTNTWYHVGYVFDGNTMKSYVDGNLEDTQNIGSKTIGLDANQHFYFGNTNPGSFIGTMDEMRISDTVRSADWIKTEYNNQNNPAGFVTEMQEEFYGASPTVSNPVFSPSAGTYPFTQSVTISSATSNSTVYYTLDGSDPTIASSQYSAPISIIDSTTVKALAVRSGYNNSAIATAVYTIHGSAAFNAGTNTITLDGLNNLHRVYIDLNNSSILSYNYSDNSYTLNANVIILNTGSLAIQGSPSLKEKLIFGGQYRIWNHGELTINNAVITSSNTTDMTQRGRILNRLWDGDTLGWKFNLTNSDVSYLGPGGLDENQETKVGIWGYAVEGSVLDAKEDIIISNNHFSHVYEINIGFINSQLTVSNNIFTDFTSDDNTILTLENGLITGNEFYNNTNYILVFSYGHPTISNNIFHDNQLQTSGSMIKLKEGGGGIQILNNNIYNCSFQGGGYAILIGSSHHTTWSTIRGNIINNVTGGAAGITLAGNGYDDGASGPGWDVRAIVEDNTITNVHTGIFLSAYSYFTAYHAPRYVVLKNNHLSDNIYGISAIGEPYIGVVSQDDSVLRSSGYDLQFGRDLVGNSQMPKFINTKYFSLSVESGYYFFPYSYLDLKAVDQSGDPISGAVITITNEVDNINYPSINIDGTNKSVFTTSSDGYTPLPSDPASSIAVLDFTKTSTTQTEMTYAITATKDGRNTTLTGINPLSSWYRDTPDTHSNTVTLTLDMTVPTYTLTVTGGTGSGSYAQGYSATITAGAPASGKVFDKWTGNTAGVVNVNLSTTTVTMSASSVNLAATYKDIPSGGSGGSSGGGPSTGGSPAPIIPAITKVEIAKTEGNILTLSLNVTNATQMMLSESSSFLGSVWETYSSTKTYTKGLTQTKLYLKFKSSTDTISSTIELNIPTNTTTTTSTSDTSPYPTGTLLKLPNSFKVYVIIDNKKKWIPTPEVFEQLGYKWTEIKILTQTELNTIPDFEDNLIRAINDYKVYLVVNGVKRHIPNPIIFLDYGFKWDEVKDVPKETIDKYKSTYLIKQSGTNGIYYVNPQEIRKLIPSTEVFNSYNDKQEDIQIISKTEMDSYPLSNLIKLNGSNDIYLIEGNIKKHIPNIQVFNKYKLSWNLVMSVNQTEFNFYSDGGELK